MVHFVPNPILQLDGSRLLDVPIDRLLSLLLDASNNAVPREGTNEDLGLVIALLAANEGGGDTTFRDLRKHRTIVDRASEFPITSTTLQRHLDATCHSGELNVPTVTLKALDDSAGSKSSYPPTLNNPLHPSPSDDSTAEHVRSRQARTWSDTSSETGDRGEDAGAAHSHALGLWTDFDIPTQVSRFRVRTVDIETAQSMYADGRVYRACTTMSLTHNSSTGTSPARTQLCHKTTRYYVPGT